eukprot:Clim_evm25s128 gene=Clim_evmTU25s128
MPFTDVTVRLPTTNSSTTSKLPTPSSYARASPGGKAAASGEEYSVSDLLSCLNTALPEKEIWSLACSCLEHMKTQALETKKMHIFLPEATMLRNDGSVVVRARKVEEHNVLFLAPEISNCPETEEELEAFNIEDCTDGMILYSLAILLWHAADYNLPEEQEPLLSEELEEFIQIISSERMDDRYSCEEALEVALENMNAYGQHHQVIQELYTEVQHVKNGIGKFKGDARSPLIMHTAGIGEDYEATEESNRVKIWNQLIMEAVEARPSLKRIDPMDRPAALARDLTPMEKLLAEIRMAPKLRRVYHSCQDISDSGREILHSRRTDIGFEHAMAMLDKMILSAEQGSSSLDIAGRLESPVSVDGLHTAPSVQTKLGSTMNMLDVRDGSGADMVVIGSGKVASNYAELEKIRQRLQQLYHAYNRTKRKLRLQIEASTKQQEFYNKQFNNFREKASQVRGNYRDIIDVYSANEKRWLKEKESMDAEMSALNLRIFEYKRNIAELHTENKQYAKRNAELTEDMKIAEQIRDRTVAMLKQYLSRRENNRRSWIQQLKTVDTEISNLPMLAAQHPDSRSSSMSREAEQSALLRMEGDLKVLVHTIHQERAQATDFKERVRQAVAQQQTEWDRAVSNLEHELQVVTRERQQYRELYREALRRIGESPTRTVEMAW